MNALSSFAAGGMFVGTLWAIAEQKPALAVFYLTLFTLNFYFAIKGDGE